MTSIIIILFRLWCLSLVHHKAIIREYRMYSYWSLWMYEVTSDHSIIEVTKSMTCNHIPVTA